VADDALRLAHDAMVERGFISTPTATGRRFDAAYLNPGTRFVVAYVEDKPIAAATLVEDGPFGLPADRAFVEELDLVRKESDSVVEVSGLVVEPRWRRRMRLVFGYVLGTVVRVLVPAPGVRRRIAFAVEPRQASMMAEVFSGGPVAGPRPMFRAPATLVVTIDAMTALSSGYYTSPKGSRMRQTVAEYGLCLQPPWLVIETPERPWRPALLPELLAQSGLQRRVEEQMAILASLEEEQAPEWGPELPSALARG
jgi:hypothetical protein